MYIAEGIFQVMMSSNVTSRSTKYSPPSESITVTVCLWISLRRSDLSNNSPAVPCLRVPHANGDTRLRVYHAQQVGDIRRLLVRTAVGGDLSIPDTLALVVVPIERDSLGARVDESDVGCRVGVHRVCDQLDGGIERQDVCRLEGVVLESDDKTPW